MRERPILFSAPMVRAILDGRKTQTRRVVKNMDSDGTVWSGRGRRIGYKAFDAPNSFPSAALEWCPYGQPGDRLWVRETWGYRGSMWSTTDPKVERHLVDYRADGEYSPSSPKRTVVRARGEESGIPKQRECRPDEDYIEDYYNGYLTRYWRQWRPSIHMPRWASRITLEVTGVRVERLNAISEEDALAEGIAPEAPDECAIAFQRLWESINGPGSWDANPFVWVVSFKRITP